MMMTIGSVPNVEPHHNNLFQHNSHQPTTSNAQSNNSLVSDMAYHFAQKSAILTSPYKCKMGEGDEMGSGHPAGGQLSPYEENETMKDFRMDMKHGLLERSEGLPYRASSNSRLHVGQYPIPIPQSTNHLPGLHENSVSSMTSSSSSQSSPQSSSKSSTLPDGNGYTNKAFPTQRPFFDDDDDDDSWKVCGVCNDKATGYHFNALTCEGCKGFFRRSMKNSKNFTCSYSNQCSITKNNRRQCQACRLRKCIQIGMKKECIMSQEQIQLKKTLILSNRVERAKKTWLPMVISDTQKVLLETICGAFVESNTPPDEHAIRGSEEMKEETQRRSPQSPTSAGSSNSSTFFDLIQRISKEITERTPKNMISQTHVLHFTDIMEFSIKQVIKFCKKIPTFMDLNLKDQIALLKSGCTEILFIKANYTYDQSKHALTLGPNIIYTRDSFLQGGMSEDYTDAYLKFHEDLSMLNLNNMEMASLSAIALFSADRADVQNSRAIEDQQEMIALALQAYTEDERKARNRFASMMSFLPKLRTLNSLCTEAFAEVHKQYGKDIHPLVPEVQPNSEVS